MARERIPRGEVLQAAYGVFDKYKMNRSFFVKTDQTSCETLPPPVEAVDATVQKAEIKEGTSDNETEFYKYALEDGTQVASVQIRK